LTYHNVVVIGASAGGIEPLTQIVQKLPADLAAPVLIVVHIGPHSPSYLAEILTYKGTLPAKPAQAGEIMRNDMVYVARPDRHLLVESNGRIRTPRGPRENGSRPAIDPLFRSTALAFGPSVIGVILSGALDDGAAGLRGIKMCGGTTIVQDPVDAHVDSMPLSALRSASVDYCLPATEIGPLLARLVKSKKRRSQAVMENSVRRQLETEVDIARDAGDAAAITEFGSPSIFTCPECHGTLLRLRGERPMRFRCHTGHGFTADSLLAELNDATDDAIWNAVRSIQEGAMLLSHLADHYEPIDATVAESYRSKVKTALERADVIRHATSEDEPIGHPEVPQEVVESSA
jgi:two-component system, chemotaxis family, protein-glutamate methylesterase/glutaminase